jgi:hypothetical protein
LLGGVFFFTQGDNSVLTQKVAKELLAAVQEGKVKYVPVALAKDADLTTLDSLDKLLKIKEQRLLAMVCSSRLFFIFILLDRKLTRT